MTSRFRNWLQTSLFKSSTSLPRVHLNKRPILLKFFIVVKNSTEGVIGHLKLSHAILIQNGGASKSCLLRRADPVQRTGQPLVVHSRCTLQVASTHTQTITHQSSATSLTSIHLCFECSWCSGVYEIVVLVRLLFKICWSHREIRGNVERSRSEEGREAFVLQNTGWTIGLLEAQLGDNKYFLNLECLDPFNEDRSSYCRRWSLPMAVRNLIFPKEHSAGAGCTQPREDNCVATLIE
jgi:hypothetical protein